MKASNHQWRDRLVDSLPAELASEIDIFENEITLKKQGKIDDKVFAETRLRRGAYGQRYDNGQRHDGVAAQKLAFPDPDQTKGPNTLWDAPGMQRIKIPFGGLNATQLEAMADLAEEYSDGIAHVTTRQDFQLHFIHIDDTPSLMRRLAAVGITTREACGNSVRNVTACPLAGVCRDQSFDVTHSAKALTYFLLGHPDCQDFGRKFKIAFSGCRDEACGLVRLHDMGALGVIREVDGKPKRGFELYVGGGLGAVPYQAKLFDEFLPEEELLPIAQAISKVFARLGEKRNRNAARIKFLINKIGIDEFKRLVWEERATLAHDPRWTAHLQGPPPAEEAPLKAPSLLQLDGVRPQGFGTWFETNVYRQRQQGYATVTVTLPLGDVTSRQLRKLADISRAFVKETIRTTVEQNFVLRWVSENDLPALYEELKSVGLHQPGAGTIVDIVACPGTDTCKLGIASSRGLAGVLRTRLAERALNMDQAIRDLRIKISGCFNSCGQHHVADIGFYGSNRNKNGYQVPHFQLLLGGKWTDNAGAYGLAMGAIPSKAIPDAIDRLTARFVSDRQGDESFQLFVKRIGKAECKKMLEDLTQVPTHDDDPSFYTDWGDAREFTIGDLGVGECAGEIVSPMEFALTACEREVFEAQLLLEQQSFDQAVHRAYESMLHGATALLRHKEILFLPESNRIVEEFRTHFFDTQLFFDPFAQGKFAQYFFGAHERLSSNGQNHSEDSAHRLIEEAQLFLEACHACYGRMMAPVAK